MSKFDDKELDRAMNMVIEGCQSLMKLRESYRKNLGFSEAVDRLTDGEKFRRSCWIEGMCTFFDEDGRLVLDHGGRYEPTLDDARAKDWEVI